MEPLNEQKGCAVVFLTSLEYFWKEKSLNFSFAGNTHLRMCLAACKKQCCISNDLFLFYSRNFTYFEIQYAAVLRKFSQFPHFYTIKSTQKLINYPFQNILNLKNSYLPLFKYDEDLKDCIFIVLLCCIQQQEKRISCLFEL